MIKSIREAERLAPEYGTSYEGFEIVCDSGDTYFFGIDSSQSCCETFGYLTSHDNFDEFIGASILNVTTTDVPLNTEVLENESVSIEDCIFVTFKTSAGDLQFTVYNEHNGYYGHNVILIKNNNTIIEDRI